MQKFTVITLFVFAVSCKSKQDNAQSAKADNWILDQDIRYEYKLNNVGNPDTTFIYTHKFKEGTLFDSSAAFYVSKYSGDLLTDIVYYNIGPDKKIIQTSNVHNEYEKNKRQQATSIYNAGKLTKLERYTYNDSNLLEKYMIVQMKVLSQAPATSDSAPHTANTVVSYSYDTVTANYKYDNARKIIGTSYTNNRGDVLRTDVNIYSGNDPLLSYSIDAKGDTVQKMKYEVDGKVLHSRLENDSFILFQNTINNMQVAQQTVFKNKPEKWRSAVIYDQKGRKTLEKVYKAM